MMNVRIFFLKGRALMMAFVMVSLATITHSSYSQDITSTWNGFNRIDCMVASRKCILVIPVTRAAGSPWIWRTEFFGHEPQADMALVAKGFHIAFIDMQNMYGGPEAMALMDRMYEHAITDRGLSKKVVLEGFSRGGLFSLNWGILHPDRVACIYNDAPVCDFKSWPGGKGKGPGSALDWQRCLEAYRLSEEEALAFRGNPIDNLASLAAAKVPLLHVCGDADEVVPFEENSALLATRYRELGGPITVIAKPGVKHHPHSLQDPEVIVSFILKHTH
ncbi:MAG: alpha/beta hydrolase [Planctomycetota bacterium]|jgi:pimeloyl-ACP methyl ester carboxylesterase|nr:MAG: alpha/beta hydrolase [Planctomycetota bacterium]